MKGFYERWGFLVRALAVVVAAAWTIFAYYSAAHNTTIRTALEYREQLRSEPLYDAWKQTMIVGLQDSKEKDAAVAAGGQTWKRYVFSRIREAETRANFDIVMSFYNEVWECVEQDICDRDTVLALFGGEAEQLYENYILHIACWRLLHNDREYGRGLTSLVATNLWQRERRLPRDYKPSAKECAFDKP